MPMTCPDCGSNLDPVPISEPCPSCGGMRRNTTVTVAPGNISFQGQEVALTVTMPVDSVTLPDPAWRRLDELATDARKLHVWVHEPDENGSVLCEVTDESGRLLAAEVGADAEDAVLNVVDLIAGTRTDGLGR